ncbi:hypothetical protein JCM3765_006895 [Sporobolomyces pararoseus]
MVSLRTLLLLSCTAIGSALAQSSSAASSSSSANNSSSVSPTPTSTSVPFFTIPNTFSPPASGSSAIPGSVIGITNGPYLSDTFSYTAALSTVPPTGNITRGDIPASRGGEGGTTDLNPDPTNLQTAAARRRYGNWEEMRSVGIVSGVCGLVVVVAGMTGAGLVL